MLFHDLSGPTSLWKDEKSFSYTHLPHSRCPVIYSYTMAVAKWVSGHVGLYKKWHTSRIWWPIPGKLEVILPELYSFRVMLPRLYSVVYMFLEKSVLWWNKFWICILEPSNGLRNSATNSASSLSLNPLFDKYV